MFSGLSASARLGVVWLVCAIARLLQRLVLRTRFGWSYVWKEVYPIVANTTRATARVSTPLIHLSRPYNDYERSEVSTEKEESRQRSGSSAKTSRATARVSTPLTHFTCDAGAEGEEHQGDRK